MTMLTIERRLLDTSATPLDHTIIQADTALEWHYHKRAWNCAIDWSSISLQTPGKARIISHVCGLRPEDGTWLDGPIIVFAADGSIAGAIPSGGPARLTLPFSALAKRGASISVLKKMEKRAHWRCLLNLVAAHCQHQQSPIVLQEAAPDLRTALVLLAVRQLFPKRRIVWLGERGDAAWQRFLYNATIDKKLLFAPPASPMQLNQVMLQINQEVIPGCVAGANRYSHLIPTALVKSGLSITKSD